MTDLERRARGPLLVASVVLVVLGLVAARAASGDDDDPGDLAAGSTTTVPGDGSTLAPGATQPGDATTVPGDTSGGTATTVPGAGQTTVPGSGTTLAPGQLGAAQVPAPGTYVYDVTQDEGDGPEETVEETVVSVLEGGGASGRFEATTSSEGGSQTSVVTVSGTGHLVEVTRIASDLGESGDCAWNPPWPIVGGLADGAEWTFESTCQTTISGAETTINSTGSGRVVGTGTAQVGGAGVAVWILETDATIEINAQLAGSTFQQIVRERAVVQFDPGRGVAVRTEATAEQSGTTTGTVNRTQVLRTFPG